MYLFKTIFYRPTKICDKTKDSVNMYVAEQLHGPTVRTKTSPFLMPIPAVQLSGQHHYQSPAGK